MARGKVSRIPSANVRFKDTRNAGGITIAGFELQTDDDGFIEAPASFESELAPHGFLREHSPAFQAWEKSKKQ